MIYGIDEAGRGPILGPMVLAVVGATAAGVEKLVRAGFKDSKGYGSGPAGKLKRKQLAEWLTLESTPTIPRNWNTPPAGVVSKYEIIDPACIDYYVTGHAPGGLNLLERDSAHDLLSFLGAAVDPVNTTIYADGASLFGPMAIGGWPGMIAVNNGESAHVTVAAASVLAKHHRDLAMAAIEQKYLDEFGTITGGGYINAGTRRFLDAYAAKYGELPPEARKSWGAKKVDV